MAALDTIPFYLCVGWLSRYLKYDPIRDQCELDAPE
jgi:hypothetical protein